VQILLQQKHNLSRKKKKIVQRMQKNIFPPQKQNQETKKISRTVDFRQKYAKKNRGKNWKKFFCQMETSKG